MKYRVIEINNGATYKPQYFDESYGWKTVYAGEEYDECMYPDIESAKNACVEHAAQQPKIVWSENL